MSNIHATAVSYGGSGVLIRGPSGSGKSDLAIRLIDDGATLIADDYVKIDVVGDKILLSPPKNITGLIEVRGIGLITIDSVRDIPLCFIVDLKPPNVIARTPESRAEIIKGISIPITEIYGLESSAVSKIKIFLREL